MAFVPAWEKGFVSGRTGRTEYEIWYPSLGYHKPAKKPPPAPMAGQKRKCKGKPQPQRPLKQRNWDLIAQRDDELLARFGKYMEARVLWRPPRDIVQERMVPVLAAIPGALFHPPKVQSFDHRMAVVFSEMLSKAEEIRRGKRDDKRVDDVEKMVEERRRNLLKQQVA